MQHPVARSKRARAQAPVLLPALVILIALLLRIMMLGVDVRLHPDEALFAAQARLITDQSDWLLRSTDLDKPPLTFYVTALAFESWGVHESTARLPNVLFSALSVAMLYALGRTLYKDTVTASLAAFLLAISPYDLAFSPTVFTDVQATSWGLIACWLTVKDRWILAGLAAALMLAAKSTMLLFVPLILALGIVHTTQAHWTARDLWRRMWAFSWPLATAIGLLVLWDLGRAPNSFFDLGYQRNNPGRLIRSDELVPRINQWVHWLSYATGSRLLTHLTIASVPIWLLVRRRNHTRSIITDWLIAGFSIAFLGWYSLVAFNTYDRYLHPLIPFLLLLSARMIVGTWRTTHRHTHILIALVLLATWVILPATITTLQGNAQIGGDQGMHTGIDTLAHTLNTEFKGATIYDHWLGWELAYYLGSTPRVTVRYVPLPEALPDTLQNSLNEQSRPVCFVAPSPEQAAPWLAVLKHTTLSATPVYHDKTYGFILYRVLADSH